jgi:hypothetical protein
MYRHNPHEWHIAEHNGAWVIEDEHGDPVDPTFSTQDWVTAANYLHELIVDELAAQQDNGPERDLPWWEGEFADNH